MLYLVICFCFVLAVEAWINAFRCPSLLNRWAFVWSIKQSLSSCVSICGLTMWLTMHRLTFRKTFNYTNVFMLSWQPNCYALCLRAICQGIRGRPGADQETRWCRDAQASPWELTGPERQRDHCIKRGIVQSNHERYNLTFHKSGCCLLFYHIYTLVWNCTYIFYTYVQYVLHRTQQELHRRYEGTPESTKTKALQTVIDMKVRV